MTVTDTMIPEGLAPPDRAFWVMPDMIVLDKYDIPKFRLTVNEVAKLFFARSGSWLRLKMHPDAEHPDTWFVLDGQPLVPQRKGTYGKSQKDWTEEDKLSARFFTLADIEPMAYSLFGFGAIDEMRLVVVIQLVKWEARLHGILEA